MNIDNLKAILQLTALQNIGSTSTDNSSTDDSSIFQNFLNELMAESGASDPTETDSNTAGSPTATLATTSLPPLSLLKSGSDSTNINQIITNAAKTFNIPTKLIASVIKQESNFNPMAVSGAGAAGLMQLMPETASSLGVNNVFDPQENVFAGSKYLKQMLEKYGNNVELALAAYNAGPGNVDKYGGIPPFEETQNYVRNITNLYNA
ncbi:MAG: lytic transglycosylase domain-containing protein [Bacillota bacterium]|nr:lytic transglycosylase domain-containing protein [Bacillota bacterium]